MLAAALQSVRSQTFKDFQLLLVEDSPSPSLNRPGYMDGTSIEFGNFKGISRALNHGLGCSTAEYIARLDSDDLMAPGRLEQQVAFLDQNPDVAVVGTWVSTFGLRVQKWRYPTTHNAIEIGMAFKNELAHPSVMIRASALNEIEGPYRPDFEGAEDWDLWERLSARWKMACVPEYLTFHRLHEGQHSRRVQVSREVRKDIQRRFVSRGFRQHASTSVTTRTPLGFLVSKGMSLASYSATSVIARFVRWWSSFGLSSTRSVGHPEYPS